MQFHVVVIGLALGAGACSGNTSEKAVENAVVANSAVAKYVPPSVTSRADYGGLIERRLKRADVNRDDKISADEMPGKNGARQLKQFDADGNGTLDSTEWGAMMLKRFDRLDVNKDGTVTSEERQSVRAKRKSRAANADADDMDEAETDLNTL